MAALARRVNSAAKAAAAHASASACTWAASRMEPLAVRPPPLAPEAAAVMEAAAAAAARAAFSAAAAALKRTGLPLAVAIAAGMLLSVCGLALGLQDGLSHRLCDVCTLCGLPSTFSSRSCSCSCSLLRSDGCADSRMGRPTAAMSLTLRMLWLWL